MFIKKQFLDQEKIKFKLKRLSFRFGGRFFYNSIGSIHEKSFLDQMRDQDPHFVIYSPKYNKNIGGIIVLHELAKELARISEACFVCDFGMPLYRARPIHMRGPVIPNLHNTIAIYPEVVDRNPLMAPYVVRWLLNKPGFFSGKFEYEQSDMFFAFSEYADAPAITGVAPKLFLFDFAIPFSDTGSHRRSGACYMIRKGKPEVMVHPTDAICLDGKRPDKILEYFRRCKMFICYDEATFYSQYAALCGCISIVIPQNYETRSDWNKARPITKYGVAFGLDDLEWAISTRHLLLPHIKALQAEGRESVNNFRRIVRERFGFRSVHNQT